MPDNSDNRPLADDNDDNPDRRNKRRTTRKSRINYSELTPNGKDTKKKGTRKPKKRSKKDKVRFFFPFHSLHTFMFLFLFYDVLLTRNVSAVFATDIGRVCMTFWWLRLRLICVLQENELADGLLTGLPSNCGGAHEGASDDLDLNQDIAHSTPNTPKTPVPIQTPPTDKERLRAKTQQRKKDEEARKEKEDEARKKETADEKKKRKAERARKKAEEAARKEAEDTKSDERDMVIESTPKHKDRNKNKKKKSEKRTSSDDGHDDEDGRDSDVYIIEPDINPLITNGMSD